VEQSERETRSRESTGDEASTMTEPDRQILPLLPQRLDVADETSPIAPVRPPDGAPNVLLVLIDDMGFAASSSYGGPCSMPTARRLADEGLRYSRFHVNALCSPTRQSLMTGRNHHSVGMGVTTEMATPPPGYNGYRPASAATLAQTLSGNGYSTAAFGKWHQTPPAEISPAGPFDRWPTGEGFDRFYGFMGAEMNHWYPQLFDGTTPVEPTRRPEDGYHLSEDIVDHAIDWISAQRTVGADRPFFAYVAFGATHAPFHVAPEWTARYQGVFDDGWDLQREETLVRQKVLGIVPEDAVLSPWAAGVPHWDDLSDVERRVAARFMETYAGFADHTDAQMGRLVDTLQDLGILDNTLVVYILGDNGASGEGGVEGTFHEHLLGHGLADDTEAMAARLDELGSASTYAIYPVGWALAMNTPYQWTKQVASHFGGTRDGMIVRWGDGIAARGEIRHHFHHVIDIVPTILEAARLPQPTVVAGVAQQPIEGLSLAYSFDDAHAPERRRRQYFEMVGNRGIYDDGWTAVTRHGVPWEMVPQGDRPFADDVWELYDTSRDWSQARDLAAAQPEKLAELQRLFDREAERYQVFPLDDRVTARENPAVAGRLDVNAGRTTVTFGPHMGRFTEEVAPNVKNRSHTITATVESWTDHDGGVLIAQGGRFGGWSLYLVDGYVTYAYNRYGRDLTTIRADRRLTQGPHTVVMSLTYDGGPPGSGADVEIQVDGVVCGCRRLAATTAFYFSFDETLNIGVDRGTPVTDEYAAVDNAFSGGIYTVRLDLADLAVEQPTPEQLRHARLTHQ
jgi:arylsulfatase A-like enzyme